VIGFSSWIHGPWKPSGKTAAMARKLLPLPELTIDSALKVQQRQAPGVAAARAFRSGRFPSTRRDRAGERTRGSRAPLGGRELGGGPSVSAVAQSPRRGTEPPSQPTSTPARWSRPARRISARICSRRSFAQPRCKWAQVEREAVQAHKSPFGLVVVSPTMIAHSLPGLSPKVAVVPVTAASYRLVHHSFSWWCSAPGAGGWQTRQSRRLSRVVQSPACRCDG
jgi:hypothetical protein